MAVIAAAGRRRAAKHIGRWSQVARCAAKPSAITGKDPLHVIISGAGVGGLLLAKALSKEPTIKVTLLEQAGYGGLSTSLRVAWVHVSPAFI